MVSIKELLLELKDNAETALDLAFCALCLKDPSLAAQVDELFEKAKLIQEKIYKLCFRLTGLEEERLAIIDLTEEILGIVDKARHIADIARAKVVPAIVKDVLKESMEKVFTGIVSPKAPIAGKEIGQLELGATIIAIKRAGKWLFEISPKTKIYPKDMLVAVGDVREERAFKSALSSE